MSLCHDQCSAENILKITASCPHQNSVLQSLKEILPQSVRRPGGRGWGGLGRRPGLANQVCGPDSPAALIISARILGRRTAPFIPFLIFNRVPHGLTQDSSTGLRGGPRPRALWSGPPPNPDLILRRIHQPRHREKARRDVHAELQRWT